MARDKIDRDDAGKTTALVTLGTTLLAPLFWADAKLGFGTALLATGGFLVAAHEVGKKRRVIENGVNKANTFFGAYTGDESTEVHNAMANIAVGGAAIFDEIMPASSNKPR